MARQPFVHERVVGVEQVDHASVFADDAFEQHLSFAAERLPQVLVEILRGRLHVREIAQVEPLAGKIVRQRLRLRIGEHPLHLLLEDLGIVELPLGGDIEQLVVRNAAPEEERQA